MKIDSIAAVLAFICFGIIVVGLVFGVTIYVNPNRSLDVIYAAQSNREFRTAIGIWGVFTFWLAVFAFRKLFPKEIAQFLTFEESELTQTLGKQLEHLLKKQYPLLKYKYKYFEQSHPFG